MLIKKIFYNRYTLSLLSFCEYIKKYGLYDGYKLSFCDIDYHFISKRFKNKKQFKLIDRKVCGRKIDNNYDFGYCVFGPIIFEFLKWLDKETKNYDQLWFLSREGWLLKRGYDIYTENNKGVYFLSSRRASSIAAVYDTDDVKEILSQYYKGGVKNLLYSRFGIITDEDFYVEMPGDTDTVMSKIDLQSLLKKALKERENYKKYINSFYKNAAVVDVGYSGTIQYNLSKILENKIDGYYLCSHFNNKPTKIGAICKSIYGVVNLVDELKNKVFKNQLYIEAVLKAPFGQLVNFDDNGNAVYDEDKSFDCEVESIQNGICDYIADIKNTENTSESFALMMLDWGIKNTDTSVLSKLSVDDSYCSDKVWKFNNLD